MRAPSSVPIGTTRNLFATPRPPLEVWTERVVDVHRQTQRGPAVNIAWNTIETLIEEMIEQQETKVLSLTRTILPTITPEDVRNPHDFPALAASAPFNYEDGILTGLRSALAAVRAERRRRS